MSFRLPMIVCLAAALTAAFAARAAEPVPVTFYPDWFPGAQFAGVYAALDRGYYREAGLAVTVVPFAYGQKTPELLDAMPDRCGLATGEGYIFLQRRAAGADLRAFGAILQRAPAGFMSLRASGIATARDFAGKTVGVHRFADPLYRWFLRRAGVAEADAPLRFVDDGLASLVRGELGAMQGFATEEFVSLQRLVGDEAHFLSFAELGFDSYSQVLYTTAAQAGRHGASLWRFVAATRRGWETVLADPEAGIAALRTRLAGADYDEAFLRDCLVALRPHIAPGGQLPLAPLERVKLARLVAVSVEIGLIPKAEPVEDFLLEPEPR